MPPRFETLWARLLLSMDPEEGKIVVDGDVGLRTTSKEGIRNGHWRASSCWVLGRRSGASTVLWSRDAEGRSAKSLTCSHQCPQDWKSDH